MTVKITKPALNLREELADLRKPSGIAGEAMLRASTVQEQRNLINAGRKNLIINGGFDVWQRGDKPDRWHSAGNVTYDNSVTSHAKFTSTTTDPHVWYKLEDIGHRLLNKTVTMSLWAKHDTSATSAIQYFAYDGHAHQNPTPTGEVDSDGFERYEFSFVLSSSTQTDKHVFRFEWSGVSGATFEVKEVQLELGSVATEFEHRSYGEELALCQRYYWRWEHDSGTSNGVYASAPYETGNNRITITFPVTLRASPTVTFLIGTGSCIVDYRSPSNIGFYGTVPFRWDDTTAGHITADAEL